jgi:hypothetical protein
MTGPRLRWRLAVPLVVVVTGTLLATFPATAQERAEVVHRTGHFPASISGTVPAGGTLMVTSPSLDSKSTSIQVTVASDDDDRDLDFALIAHFVAKRKTPGQRLLACIALTQVKLAGWDGFNTDLSMVDENKTKALLFLDTCLRLARLIEQIESGTRSAPVTPALSAKSRCSQAAKQFPALEEKTSTGYRLTVNGQAATAKKKGGFKIKCQVSSGKVVYTIRSRKKGQTLQKLLGPQVAFGLYSPTGATASVPVTVTFGKPH